MDKYKLSDEEYQLLQLVAKNTEKSIKRWISVEDGVPYYELNNLSLNQVYDGGREAASAIAYDVRSKTESLFRKMCDGKKR